MVEDEDGFDFTPTRVYTQEEFNRTVVKGPADMRQVVELAAMVKRGDPYLGCLMGMTKDRCVSVDYDLEVDCMIELMINWIHGNNIWPAMVYFKIHISFNSVPWPWGVYCE